MCPDTLIWGRRSGYLTSAPRFTIRALECPPIFSTDLDDLTCKTPLVGGASSVTAQRITSVAWKRSAGGTVILSASAVLRLMTSTNVVGRSTGRSAGRAPLRILST
jgi:hypothetical protein